MVKMCGMPSLEGRYAVAMETFSSLITTLTKFSSKSSKFCGKKYFQGRKISEAQKSSLELNDNPLQHSTCHAILELLNDVKSHVKQTSAKLF